jgi:hypothetical protein
VRVLRGSWNRWVRSRLRCVKVRRQRTGGVLVLLLREVRNVGWRGVNGDKGWQIVLQLGRVEGGFGFGCLGLSEVIMAYESMRP